MKIWKALIYSKKPTCGMQFCHGLQEIFQVSFILLSGSRMSEILAVSEHILAWMNEERKMCYPLKLFQIIKKNLGQRSKNIAMIGISTETANILRLC